jgi:hypothetical protein
MEFSMYTSKFDANIQLKGQYGEDFGIHLGEDFGNAPTF